MARYVTVSRAARLAGVSRGALQKRIRNGELTTFEGMLEVNELLRVFPDTQMEETALLQRVEEIMETAVNKVVHGQPSLPDAETLAARVSGLSHELALLKAESSSYQILLEKIEHKLEESVQQASLPAAQVIEELRKWLHRAIEQRAEYADVPQQLIAREAFLRIMEATVKVFPSGREFSVQGTESLLESSLKAGQVPEYGCSDGTCGKCKVRIVSGRVRKVRDFPDVSAEDRDQGRVLMCANTALTDLVIEASEADGPGDIAPDQSFYAQVKGVERRSGDVMLVNVRTPHAHRLRFMAGQYATVQADDLEPQDCFIASCPCEERNLQFHLSNSRRKALVEGMMRSLENADPILLKGPQGSFTLKEDSARPSVLIAMGLGFAPIKSILEHAMSVDSKESITLFWAAPKGEHYMQNLCRAWADAIDDFSYVPLIVPGTADQADFAGVSPDILDGLISEQINPASADYYIAGPEAAVDKLIETLTARDVGQEHIHRQHA